MHDRLLKIVWFETAISVLSFFGLCFVLSVLEYGPFPRAYKTIVVACIIVGVIVIFVGVYFLLLLLLLLCLLHWYIVWESVESEFVINMVVNKMSLFVVMVLSF